MYARGRVGAHSTRLGEAKRWVVALDHMVAGVAGGDQKNGGGTTMCSVDDQRDELEMKFEQVKTR